MRSYYVLHDVENMKIGFINANQDAAPVNTELIQIIGLWILLILCLIISVCLVFCYLYKRRQFHKQKTQTWAKQTPENYPHQTIDIDQSKNPLI